jgi:hypothetical protein
MARLLTRTIRLDRIRRAPGVRYAHRLPPAASDGRHHTSPVDCSHQRNLVGLGPKVMGPTIVAIVDDRGSAPS